MSFLQNAFPLNLPIGNRTDSYKITHWRLYPEGLESVFSYLEARSPSPFSNKTVFFGLQYLLKAYMQGSVVLSQDFGRLRAFCKHHFGDEKLFNEQGWRYIVEKHKGRLPVSIKAIREGTVVPVGNALMTIENTDPNCAWLTNFLETTLMNVWYPITVASQSRSIKENIHKFMTETTDDELIPVLLPSRLHDFGYRGVTCPEAASIGGAGHLVNFKGTDTIGAIELITQFYSKGRPVEGADYEAWEKFYSQNMPGYSIPATEHSIMTILGQEGELAMCRRVLEQFPNGLVACVSDSYDIDKCCEQIWGTELKKQIIARDGCLVVRPDSGDPSTSVCKVLRILGNKFEYRKNGKDFNVLPNCIRVIQGDGINWQTVSDVLGAMKDDGWAVDNIAFGSGGGLLQQMNRDTYAMAMKACHSVVNGIARDVFKTPKEDGAKDSKKGRLALSIMPDGTFDTVPESEADSFGGNQLVEVFRNGVMLIDYPFAEICERAELEPLKAVAV